VFTKRYGLWFYMLIVFRPTACLNVLKIIFVFSDYLCFLCPQQLYATCNAKPHVLRKHTCTGIVALTDATIRRYHSLWDKCILSRVCVCVCVCVCVFVFVWRKVLFLEKRMENGRRFVSSSIVSARMQHLV